MKAVVAAFNQEKALVGAFSVITNLRMDLFEDTDAAGETDLLVAHYDASEHLHCYNPDTGRWAPLAELPQGAGVEYAAITGDTETLYLL